MPHASALITGGLGFLGRSVARQLKSEGFQVHGIGHAPIDSPDPAALGFDHWLQAPVLKRHLETLSGTYELVVHCAGSGTVGYSLAHPDAAYRKTVESTVELLEWMRLRHDGMVLIYPSSAGVYGAKEDAPIHETAALNPIAPYGFHKRMAEEICECYARSFQLRVAVIRFFSIYGPGLTKQLLWDASRRLVSESEGVTFWGSGEETRDWIHVEDAARLISTLKGFAGTYDIYNGAVGDRVTIRQVLTSLSRFLGREQPLAFNGIVRVGDPMFYHADVNKTFNTGWRPAVTLEAGLQKYARWFLGCQHG